MEQEQEIQELNQKITSLTEERDGLLAKAQEAEKQAKIAETKAAVEKAVGEADLPEAAKARVVKQFEEAESSEGLEEAIKAESEYVAEIRGDGKVKGLGESIQSTEAGKKALREAIKNANPDWTDEQVETALNAR